MNINKINKIRGEITIPGDKSISHRGIMIGALSEGITRIKGFLLGADCISTINCFRALGVKIDINDDEIIVYGKGLKGLKKPETILDVGNSGTTARLISGILSGMDFTSKLTGDESICSRPMGRIIKPLSEMGSKFYCKYNNDKLPMTITGGNLKATSYNSSVASAQVKSSILLAGLYAKEPTSVTEPYVSRNHTELMVNYFGGKVETIGTTATIYPEHKMVGKDLLVPGDISSAAYFITLGLLCKDSKLVIKNVGINPTRDGIIDVFKSMGGNIDFVNKRYYGFEKVCDIIVNSSELTGTTICGSLIPKLIDEIPIIAVAAAFAKGDTIIKDASELKVKESNRLELLIKNLQNLGVKVTPLDDGMIIHGGNGLKSGTIETKKDHRMAMSFSIGNALINGHITIPHLECVKISYPNFYEDLFSLSNNLV